MPGRTSLTAVFPVSTLVSIFMLPIRGVLWWTVGAQLWAITSVVSWISAFFSFPIRVLTAAYREKQAQAELEELRVRCNYWRESVVTLQATRQQLMEETVARERDRAKIEARLARVLAQRKQLQQLLEESLRQLEERELLASMHRKGKARVADYRSRRQSSLGRHRVGEIEEIEEVVEGEGEEEEGHVVERRSEGSSSSSYRSSSGRQRGLEASVSLQGHHPPDKRSSDGPPLPATSAQAAMASAGQFVSLFCLLSTAVLSMGIALQTSPADVYALIRLAAMCAPSLAAMLAFSSARSSSASVTAAQASIPLLFLSILAVALLSSVTPVIPALLAVWLRVSQLTGKVLLNLLSPQQWLSVLSSIWGLLLRLLAAWLSGGSNVTHETNSTVRLSRHQEL